MPATLYRSAQIASEDAAPKSGDVLVEGGKIAAVGDSLAAPEGAEVIDCAGLILLPGLFDPHVHFREPGQEHKENIMTGSEAAINGGVTGVVAMPNTAPAIDTGGMVKTVLESAERSCRIDFYTSGCITKGREGKELAGIAGMKDAGVVLLTDDGSPVGNPRVLRRAMEYARGFDLPFASHAETMELSGNGAMNEGRISYKLGIPGIPPESEEICIDRDIRIARLAGARLHIQHVTTYRGLLIIKRAKEDGCAVTCEVSPHHLIFNEEDITGYDANYKMNPPLRTKADNEGLLQALIDGDFDIIATDHAPHSELEKANDFASAPFGITGLETALPSLYHHFIKPGVFGWDLVVRRYCVEPRKIIGVPPAEIKAGARANFILFDPARQTTFDREFTKSKSTNTPFFNRSLDGMVARVVLDDETLLAR